MTYTNPPARLFKAASGELTGSRAIDGTAYTNTLLTPRFVVVVAYVSNNLSVVNLYLNSGGEVVCSQSIPVQPGLVSVSVSMIVPPGVAYLVNGVGLTLSHWHEVQ